jgi:hypothetical protein
MNPIVTVRIEVWVVPAMRRERLNRLKTIRPIIAIRPVSSNRTEAQ